MKAFRSLSDMVFHLFSSIYPMQMYFISSSAAALRVFMPLDLRADPRVLRRLLHVRREVGHLEYLAHLNDVTIRGGAALGPLECFFLRFGGDHPVAADHFFCLRKRPVGRFGSAVRKSNARAFRAWMKPVKRDQRSSFRQLLVELHHPGDGLGGRRESFLCPLSSRSIRLVNPRDHQHHESHACFSSRCATVVSNDSRSGMPEIDNEG